MATFYMTADAEMYHCGLGYSDELYHYDPKTGMWMRAKPLPNATYW